MFRELYCDVFANFLLSQDLVILKRNLNNKDENPCFLYLRCGPDGGEEIASIGILSSARNMEVYLGEEYCGTSRGKNVYTVLDYRTVRTWEIENPKKQKSVFKPRTMQNKKMSFPQRAHIVEMEIS